MADVLAWTVAPTLPRRTVVMMQRVQATPRASAAHGESTAAKSTAAATSTVTVMRLAVCPHRRSGDGMRSVLPYW